MSERQLLLNIIQNLTESIRNMELKMDEMNDHLNEIKGLGIFYLNETIGMTQIDFY